MKKSNLFRLFFYWSLAQYYTASLSTDRIVGGTTTTRSAWPSILNLQTTKRGLFCGANFLGNFKRKDGSLRSWVLTAAHCCDPMLTNITVSMFTPNSNEYKKLPTWFVWNSKVQRKYIHPKYDVASGSYDFCILQLNKTLSIQEGFLEPARLVSAFFSVTGLYLNGVAVGWGSTNENEQNPSQVLRKVTVPIIDTSACNAIYNASQDITISQDMLCAGTGGRDGCLGDSGGPLYALLDDVHVILAVSSFGIGCGRPGLPGVYGNVRFARPWIDKTLQN